MRLWIWKRAGAVFAETAPRPGVCESGRSALSLWINVGLSASRALDFQGLALQPIGAPPLPSGGRHEMSMQGVQTEMRRSRDRHSRNPNLHYMSIRGPRRRGLGQDGRGHAEGPQTEDKALTEQFPDLERA